jgi:hypothetical protein
MIEPPALQPRCPPGRDATVVRGCRPSKNIEPSGKRISKLPQRGTASCWMMRIRSGMTPADEGTTPTPRSGKRVLIHFGAPDRCTTPLLSCSPSKGVLFRSNEAPSAALSPGHCRDCVARFRPMKRGHYVSIISMVVTAGLVGAGALVVGQSRVPSEATAFAEKLSAQCRKCCQQALRYPAKWRAITSQIALS